MNNKNKDEKEYKVINIISEVLKGIWALSFGICFVTLFIGFLALVFAQENVFNNDEGELFAEGFICSFIIFIIFMPLHSFFEDIFDEMLFESDRSIPSRTELKSRVKNKIKKFHFIPFCIDIRLTKNVEDLFVWITAVIVFMIRHYADKYGKSNTSIKC